MDTHFRLDEQIPENKISDLEQNQKDLPVAYIHSVMVAFCQLDIG